MEFWLKYIRERERGRERGEGGGVYIEGDSGCQRNWIIERIKKVEEVTELCSGNGDWWSDGAICADAADWDQFHQAMLGQVLHWRQPDYAASAGIGQWFHRFSQTARRQE